jgi:hypothetical protein
MSIKTLIAPDLVVRQTSLLVRDTLHRGRCRLAGAREASAL